MFVFGYQWLVYGVLETLIPIKLSTKIPRVWRLWRHNDMPPHKNREIQFLYKSIQDRDKYIANLKENDKYCLNIKLNECEVSMGESSFRIG